MARVDGSGQKIWRWSNPACRKHWSGFRLRPVEVEFWCDGAFRLHDRVQFTRTDPLGPNLYPVKRLCRQRRIPADRAINNQLMQRATQASVMVAVTLMVLKAYAYLVSDSPGHAGILARFRARLSWHQPSICWPCVTPQLRPMKITASAMKKPKPLASLAQAAFIMGSAGFLGLERCSI